MMKKDFQEKIGHAGIGFQELGNAEILFQMFRKLEKQVFQKNCEMLKLDFRNSGNDENGILEKLGNAEI